MGDMLQVIIELMIQITERRFKDAANRQPLKSTKVQLMVPRMVQSS